MEFIAHRGESLAAPENTLEAFNLAWSRGATGIEGDFHLSQDGYIVCMHDDNAKRTADVDRKLADMTLAEIRALDAGSFKGKDWKYTRVPTLEEVLSTIPPHGRIFIELKCADGIVDKLKYVFAATHLKKEQLVIITFDEDTIRAVKRELPGHKALLLIWIDPEKTVGRKVDGADDMIRILRSVGADGVDCCCHDFIDRAWVEKVKNAGFEFHVWTVDDPETAKRFMGCGVDSITSNCAYILEEELK